MKRVRHAAGLLAFALAGCLAQSFPVEGEPELSVIRTMGLAVVTDGKSAGFDLDGWSSVKGDPRGCRQQDFESPDGRPGIDNQFSAVVPLLDLAGEGALQAFIQNAIDEGRLLILPEISRRGRTVTLTLRRGEDVPLLGTDGKLLEDQTLALDPLGATFGTFEGATLVETRAAPGRVSSLGAPRTLSAGPFELDLPVVVFEILYEAHLSYARLEVSFDEQGVGRGAMAGAVSISELRRLAKVAGERANVDILGLLGSVLEELADLDQDSTGACHALSLTATFETVPAFAYEP
ncbi:MAG: hypothetical protein HYV07_03435 [Deltaproteobacteria bacterium]|nr:hypothetical protein [Deltaproteobacteria bacterium]